MYKRRERISINNSKLKLQFTPEQRILVENHCYCILFVIEGKTKKDHAYDGIAELLKRWEVVSYWSSMRKCSQICKIFVWKVFLLRLEEWDGERIRSLYYTVKYTCAKHLATLKSFDFMVVWSLDLSPHHHGLIQKLYILTQPSYTMCAMITWTKRVDLHIVSI